VAPPTRCRACRASPHRPVRSPGCPRPSDRRGGRPWWMGLRMSAPRTPIPVRHRHRTVAAKGARSQLVLLHTLSKNVWSTSAFVDIGRGSLGPARSPASGATRRESVRPERASIRGAAEAGAAPSALWPRCVRDPDPSARTRGGAAGRWGRARLGAPDLPLVRATTHRGRTGRRAAIRGRFGDLVRFRSARPGNSSSQVTML
jgi:hypothetical protein